MKHLKKHPKQQRMEDMTFPLIKPNRLTSTATLEYKCSMHPNKPSVFSIVYGDETRVRMCSVCLNSMKKMKLTIPKEKAIWEGREWLRSISDPHHERHVAVVILLVASIIYCVAIFLWNQS